MTSTANISRKNAEILQRFKTFLRLKFMHLKNGKPIENYDDIFSKMIELLGIEEEYNKKDIMKIELVKEIPYEKVLEMHKEHKLDEGVAK
ncbi:MAG: hypothetical protein ABEK36_06220 [Candidatus Aenigmatarchaeota archaeon]